jgi:hypothetical protein
MRILGKAAANPSSPFRLLAGEAAAAVRRRRAEPRCWVQLHLGFLCEERRKETRRVNTHWQVGRQPGNWVWPSLDAAVRFMGALEPGQGQPAILSTWAPAWPTQSRIPALQVARALSGLLEDTAWGLVLRGVPLGSLAKRPGTGQSVWRLKVGRQHADTDIRAWVLSPQ